MPHELPGKRPFFKYASSGTALTILKNRTLQYSSPGTFNDPFDVQSGLHFDFDPATLHRKVVSRISELARRDRGTLVNPDDAWGQVVLEARKQFPVIGFDPDRWLASTAEAFAEIVPEIAKTQRDYQQLWWGSMVPSARVFCVSEAHDDLLMWAHYAQNHTGLVFEFWSLPEDDNALSVAGAVEYVDSPPPFFSEAEWIDDLVGIKQLDHRLLSKRYFYLKSRHWSYEREWRVWYTSEAAGVLHDYVPIRQSEFASIYLGCRADPEFAKSVVDLARSSFPRVRIFEASKRRDSYRLRFSEI